MRNWSGRIEWPTVAVAIAIYAVFGTITWFHEAIPWWLLMPLGGVVVAWHGSLQHEVVHGHPTPWSRVNAWIVFPSLWLWLPFEAYRRSHLAHHRTDALTNPLQDPESFYLTPRAWARTARPVRALLVFNNTCVGRLTVGPLIVWGSWLRGGYRHWARGCPIDRAMCLTHTASLGLVLAWVVGVCGLPLLEYVVLFAYPGLSLTLLRSYAEHQAREPALERTAIVEAGPLLSLLYLNNNLHATHHESPHLPWYAIPARWREQRETTLRTEGVYHYPGYVDVFRRHWLRAKEPVAHPL